MLVIYIPPDQKKTFFTRTQLLISFFELCIYEANYNWRFQYEIRK